MSVTEEEVDELELLTRPGREEDLRTFLLLLHPADVADLITEVDEATSRQILKQLDSERAADLISELDPSEQEQLAQILEPQELAPIVGEMETDDITDLLQELDPGTAAAVLEILPEEDREEVTELLKYDPESAGGIMQLELVALPITATVAEAVEAARADHHEMDVHSLFIVDGKGRYLGDVDLPDLVFAPPHTKLSEIMTPKVAEVSVNLDQEQVARIFDHYSLLEVGVVDAGGRLRGRITADDIHEVLVEEAEEDMLLVAGAGAEPELVYSNKVLRIVGARLPWLMSTFCAGLLASWILQQADVVFGTVVVLLTFVPVITGMSGNVGTQSAMIMIRGLAVGHIDASNLAASIGRDLLVGLIMAMVCGVSVVALIDLWHGTLALGLCVGIALFLSMVTASVLGSVEPPLLQRFGVDPAIAAGPLITSINDITGVCIYALVARVFLSQLA